jgi:hypothetical protein
MDYDMIIELLRNECKDSYESIMSIPIIKLSLGGIFNSKL